MAFFTEERHSKMMEICNVCWIGVSAAESQKFADSEHCKVVHGGKQLTLRDGYIAIREACIEGGKWETVLCMVMGKSEEG